MLRLATAVSNNSFLSRIDTISENFLNKKVWLSRSNYPGGYKNEEKIQQVLSRDGWIIIYPENLNLTNQASIFNSAFKVAGIEGSAFHTQVLCKGRKAETTIFSRPRKYSVFYRRFFKVSST